MTTPAAAAGSVSRGTLLNQPRSGAKPLGNSPGAGPGPSRSPGPGPSSGRASGAPNTPAGAPRRNTPVTGTQAAPRRTPPRQQQPQRPGKGGGGKGGGGKKKPVLQRRPGARTFLDRPPEYRNYQAVILAEFVAAELLVAATPMATRRNQPGLSPYVPKDLVQLVAIGVVYLVLEMIAVGGRGAGRVSAWLGALVLLTVGLGEASNLAKVFAFLTGGTGKPQTETASTVAAQPTSIQQFSGAAPTLGTNETAAGGAAPGGGSGPRSGSAFVQEAAKFIGTPYRWGGAAPGGFDCSGLVEYALTQMGVRGVPRTSEEQWGWVDRIPESQLAPGDLIFEQWPGEQSPGHVAVYAGAGEIIQAPAPGEDVQRVKWSPSIVHSEGGQIVGYGRVPGLTYSGATQTGRHVQIA